jgi:hypothetical protein
MRLKPSRVKLQTSVSERARDTYNIGAFSAASGTHKKPEASQGSWVSELNSTVILGMAVATMS